MRTVIIKEIWSTLESYDWQLLEEEVVEPLFKKQIEYVALHSPFYHKKFGLSNNRFPTSLQALKDLPFTDKQEIFEDEKMYPSFGSNLTGRPERIQRIHRTSGTSTEPLLLALSMDDLEATVECGARCFWAAGVRPHDTVVHCLNYCMWAGGITDHQSLERTGAAVIPYGVGNSSNLIRTILLLRPTGIHCTPSYLSILEELIKDEFRMAPSQLGLKIGLFGGEGGLENEEFRSHIERIWGFKAMNANYGMSEALSMFGAECRERAGLHFMGQGVIHAELKDVSGDHVLAWEPGARGELLLTNLCKEMQPLVRYRTSDIVEVLGMGLCPCGRQSPRFRIVGRREDMIVVKGVNVFLSSVTAAINQRLEVLTGDFRVAVNKLDPIEHFIIRVEIRKNKTSDNLERELEEFFKQKIYVRPKVELFPEGTMLKTSGKTKRLERIL